MTTLAGGPKGWLLLPPASVPDAWKTRSVPMALVPLLPEEVTNILSSGSTAPALDPFDERIAGLLAEGASIATVASRLRVSERTVDRHVDRLKKYFRVDSKEQLAVRLAGHSFGDVARSDNSETEDNH